MDEFDKFMPAVEALARRIFDAGAMAERRRILTEVGGSLKASRSTAGRVGYGEGKAAVVDALKTMPVAEHGVSVREVAEYCPDIGAAQIRSVLKNLADSGRATRPVRGRYRLSLNS